VTNTVTGDVTWFRYDADGQRVKRIVSVDGGLTTTAAIAGKPMLYVPFFILHAQRSSLLVIMSASDIVLPASDELAIFAVKTTASDEPEENRHTGTHPPTRPGQLTWPTTPSRRWRNSMRETL